MNTPNTASLKLFSKIPLLLTLLFYSCLSSPPHKATLLLPSGEKVHIKLAIDPKDQERGLSGIKPQDFPDDQGLFFVYPDDGIRHFWMPDTYFNIDIFYFDKDLKVIHVLRNVPHHPGFNEPPKIYRAKPIYARHVLEMKAHSALAKKIQEGDQLIWHSTPALWQIEQGIRHQQ